MPMPPYPVMPAPRTWSTGDKALTSLLRADLGNAALLLANRPMLVAAQTTLGQSVGTAAWHQVGLDTEYLDNWGTHQVPSAVYPVPLGGWYLLSGDTSWSAFAATANAGTGFRAIQNSVTTDAYCGLIGGNDINYPQPNGALLAQFDPTTGDTASLLGWQGTAGSVNLQTARFKAEWVAQPTTLGYGTGTVVTSPQPAALWPAGAGTSIVGSIAAGATSMTVQSATGMVIGSKLGLDYYEGQSVSPMAETVTITSIAGTTIGISATLYPHGGGLSPGLVAVPVDAPWMNQQVRDMVNFLCFPPICQVYGGTASLASSTFPAGTAIPLTTGTTVDNFSGWSNANNRYTFPVSGNYYIYGQVASSTASEHYQLSAGLGISGGTIQWGSSASNHFAGSPQYAQTATVRRHLRVAAGQYVQLFGNTDGTTALALPTAYATGQPARRRLPRLLAPGRGAMSRGRRT